MTNDSHDAGVRGAAEPRTRTSVIVVHGVWMRGASMRVLRRRLEASGFDVHVFSYPSVSADLAANAAKLAAFIDAVPAATVHVVAHSLGGVLVRAMLETARSPRLGRVVCLGSPFTGSRTAARVARLPGGARLIGRSLGDVLARGGFDSWRAPHEVGIIAGHVSFGFGLLFGPFGEPNDGTVAIAETRLTDAHDHIVLRVAHMALLWSPAVARQVLHFLEHGAFAHP
jgi:pimeloyl-ACP methyl ester carboxylesterase